MCQFGGLGLENSFFFLFLGILSEYNHHPVRKSMVPCPPEKSMWTATNRQHELVFIYVSETIFNWILQPQPGYNRPGEAETNCPAQPCSDFRFLKKIKDYF
jgi:hypothetical protein